MSFMSLTLRSLLDFSREIGCVDYCNGQFQQQLANRVELYCAEENKSVSDLTLLELAELIRAETANFNGGAA